MLATLVLVPSFQLAPTPRATAPRAATPLHQSLHQPVITMGIFDAFKKAFANEDYAKSPGLYAQTKAQARHVLVSSEEEALNIAEQIKNGADFAAMARQYSSCNSKTQGGNLGSFSPKTMVPEFDAAVFTVDDAAPLGTIQGPIKTKFGHHLIKVVERSDS